MKLSLGKSLVVVGILLIAVPPATVYALSWYVTATKADWWDLLGFALIPLAFLAMAAGAVTLVIGVVNLLINRFWPQARKPTKSGRDLLAPDSNDPPAGH